MYFLQTRPACLAICIYLVRTIPVSAANIDTDLLNDLSLYDSHTDIDTNWTLPPIPFTSSSARDIDNAALSTMFDWATGLVDAVFVPFADIQDWLYNFVASPDPLTYLGDNYTELVGYSVGWIVCFVVGFIYIVTMPLALIIFTCCRCICGLCGHSNTQSKEEGTSIWRWVNCISLLLLTTVLLIGAVFVYLTNDWINDVVVSLPDNTAELIGTLTDYVNGTSAQVSYMVDTFEVVYISVNTTVAALGTTFVAPIVNVTLEMLEPTFRNFTELPDYVTAIERQMNQTDLNLVDLQVAETAMDAEITTAQTALDDGTCDTSVCPTTMEGCTELCQISKTIWITGTSATTLDSLSDVVSALNDLITTINIDGIVEQSNEAIAQLTEQANELTAQISDEIESYLVDINVEVDSTLSVIRQGSEALNEFSSTLDGYTDDVRSVQDDVETINYYRWAIGIALMATVLVVVVLNYLGIAFGVFCPGSKNPSQRSTLSHIGSRILMLSSFTAWLFSCFLMILVVIFFSLGGFSKRYFCEPIQPPNYELIEFGEFAAQNLSGYSVATSLESTGLQWVPETVLDNVTVVGILNDCQRNAPIWQLAKLDYVPVLDTLAETLVNNITTYTDEIEKVISTELTSTIESLISSSDLLGYLDELDGLSTDIAKLLDSPIIDTYVSFLDSGTQLTVNNLLLIREQIANVQTVPETNAANEQGYAIETIDYTIETLVPPVELNLATFNTSVYDLTKSVNDLTQQLVIMENSINTSIVFFQNDFAVFVTDSAEDIIGALNDEIISFANWTIVASETELGQCQNIYSIYEQTDEIVCSDVIDTVNGFWFSLGWCVACLPFSVFLSIKTSKYFKKFDHDYDEF